MGALEQSSEKHLAHVKFEKVECGLKQGIYLSVVSQNLAKLFNFDEMSNSGYREPKVG